MSVIIDPLQLTTSWDCKTAVANISHFSFKKYISHFKYGGTPPISSKKYKPLQ
jgi:hypothetical protein